MNDDEMVGGVDLTTLLLTMTRGGDPLLLILVAAIVAIWRLYSQERAKNIILAKAAQDRLDKADALIADLIRIKRE